MIVKLIYNRLYFVQYCAKRVVAQNSYLRGHLIDTGAERDQDVFDGTSEIRDVIISMKELSRSPPLNLPGYRRSKSLYFRFRDFLIKFTDKLLASAYDGSEIFFNALFHCTNLPLRCTNLAVKCSHNMILNLISQRLFIMSAPLSRILILRKQSIHSLQPGLTFRPIPYYTFQPTADSSLKTILPASRNKRPGKPLHFTDYSIQP
ncbi:methylmalonate-semialdehyde dehydrogenase, putative [Babesia ovata]|uniref:Methylmalonate-semialdehyde dehydrogenase, putative n=1 Tax=Babesia ovata TaxID=189622 RepID=A0A2H6KDT8_9APIC|nr:methylmalonate-semialdehyde dehydrogenase, putative [Babesia ovata]GBE61155.1 methylmalonate-semialdehyde dehydrogenase, putative [Babesia ovata]